MIPSRPRVALNMAASIDGKINPAPAHRHGAFTMSRHRHDLERMRVIRARADAIVIGAGNLRADDPDLALDDASRAALQARGAREPLRVLVTTRGEGITLAHAALDGARGGETIVAHAGSMPRATRELLAERAVLLELGAETVDIARLLAWLVRERGVRALLSEGGGALNAELFAARAVDELYLTLVPRVLGGATAPTMIEGAGFGPDAIPDATLADVERIGDELFLRYAIAWPDTPRAPHET